MIPRFTDHAANERTFLAWVRTGISVIAVGFVLEKFNLFILALDGAAADAGKVARFERLSGPLGRYDGFALMVTGIVLIGIAYFRFAQNESLINETEIRKSFGVRAEMIVSVLLVMLVTAYCISILSA